MSLELSSAEEYALVFQQRIRSFREQLVLESKIRARQEDRISELPNAVLCHILSFVPTTKHVVRTSVLSTRWKNIWAYVPNLYLDDDEFSSSADFIAFVDRVLLVRDSSAIQRFHLHFNNCHAEHFSRIDGWISTAVRYNVVELDLSIDLEEDDMFELPISLLTCKTLKVLILSSMFIINMPTSVCYCFPSLEILHIHFTVTYRDKISMDLFHFPVLEYLSIDGDLGHNVLDFNISAPELKTLRIDLYSLDYLHDLYNFFIDAPKLEKLDLQERSLPNFNFNNTKSLVEANLYIYHDEDYVEEDSVNRATEFLAQISTVKYLSLSWSIYQACSVPAFDSLSKLRLVHSRSSYWWRTLMKLLERSPNLECLSIDDCSYQTRRQLDEEVIEQAANRAEEIEQAENGAEVIEQAENGAEVIDLTEQIAALVRTLNWVPPDSIPKCLPSHLKTISIKGFYGKGTIGYLDQMELIKYLLKNSSVLEKMTIYTPGLYMGTKEEFFDALSMFEWGSKTVQVEMIEKKFYQ
ncbi:F-box/LRR-repeat protein [Rosa sericea]